MESSEGKTLLLSSAKDSPMGINSINENMKIIDTPGFSSLVINLTKEELAKSYFDFKNWSKLCEFNSCLHYKEKNCEIKKQLEMKKLLNSRYENYIKMLLEILGAKKNYD